MEKKICRRCQEAGKKSIVYADGQSTTLMHDSVYYDENGDYHYHPSNRTTAGFRCRNGHVWTEDVPSSCACGWTNALKEKILWEGEIKRG